MLVKLYCYLYEKRLSELSERLIRSCHMLFFSVCNTMLLNVEIRSTTLLIILSNLISCELKKLQAKQIHSVFL